MNIENIRKTIELIDANRDEFSMDQYRHPCGSPACIAGWAATLEPGNLNPDGHLTVSRGTIANVAANILGLNELWAVHELFEPCTNINWSNLTADDAIAALNKLIKFGEVEEPMLFPMDRG